jgi:hypothetical protein
MDKQLVKLILFIVIVFIALLTIKLTLAVTLSWIWIISPFWIQLAIIALFYILTATGIGSRIVDLYLD